ncbi:ATP-dependent DNA helicase, partial [Leucobacter sp. M11]|uniref:ATP-dependent DNA helicase n=1 Tax=Leucobacter sp. M11 TaxID=2993565 RepID=UPI002D80DA6A
VLLDEYQDTSVGQTRLLAELFAGNSVMAVGDPHQSIYGWRGASSENLTTFPREFRARGEAGRSNTLSLSVSWRNASVVLDAANVVAAPLRAESAVPVAKLLPRPAAPRGSVETRFPETLHEETRAVAEWFAERRAGHLAERGELPTSALIFRNRGHMARFSQALDERGVPNRIIGLGGLLSTPEITDLVAALRCLWFADAGSELIRLLTGPRFGVGVLDLRALKSAASWFAERDGSHRLLAEGERGEDRALPDPDRQVTLLDALDEIARLPEGHLIAQKFTEPGLARLREAASVLSGLRARVGHGVAELVRATETALRLDIEVMANERAPDAGDARARGNLDAFHEIVEDFLRVDDAGSLASLLAWVERATVEDEHAEQLAAPDPNSVQLITAHGSKGLEWDLVAVPRLVSAEFPGPSKEAKGWLRTGVLPDALRGDAASRPVLDWRLCATQQEFKEAVEAYSAEVKARHADEERRLGYVALTRARSELLLTGSFWGGQTRPRGPSEYLTELAEAGLIPELPAESAVEENPLLGAERTLLWPLDPLGARREAVLAAAARVRAGVEARVAADAAPADLDPTVRLLLAERSAGRVPETPLAGARVNASAFHDVVADPRLAARRALRPMPQQPFRQTRVGNAFHEWVERRSATALGTRLELELADFDWDSLGAGPGSADGSLDGAPGQVAGEEPVAEAAEPDPSELFEAAAADALTPVDLRAELAPLIATFERSRWASRQPELVELEVSVPFAGTRLVCKIDAVYRDTASTPGAPADADREPSYEIVDWKAGRAPRTEAERRDRFLQLDLYRHAFATWRGIPPERVRVSLFYVAEDLELTNEAPLPIAELERRWLAATSG